MERETKISVTIFLVVLIYGLGSVLNNGSFITPFFLNPLIVATVSIVFFVINIKKPGSMELGLVALAFISFALQDSFTIELFVERFKLSFLNSWTESTLFNFATFACFYFVLIRSVLHLHAETEKRTVVLIPGLFLVAVMVLYLMESYFIQSLLMMGFCVSFFYIAQRLTTAPHSNSRICSAVYLLLFLLEFVEFFS